MRKDDVIYQLDHSCTSVHQKYLSAWQGMSGRMKGERGAAVGPGRIRVEYDCAKAVLRHALGFKPRLNERERLVLGDRIMSRR